MSCEVCEKAKAALPKPMKVTGKCVRCKKVGEQPHEAVVYNKRYKRHDSGPLCDKCNRASDLSICDTCDCFAHDGLLADDPYCRHERKQTICPICLNLKKEQAASG